MFIKLKKPFSGAVFAVGLLAAQGAATAQEAAQDVAQQKAETQEIYRAADFVADWSVKGMRLSPNGEFLSYTMPLKDGTILLVVADFDGAQLRPLVGMPFNEDAYPVDVRWATNDRLIFTLRQKSKISRTKYYTWSEVLMSVKADGTELTTLRTDGSGGASLRHIDNADIISMLRDDPDHILVGKSRRRTWVQEVYEGAIDDVYKLNIRTGDLSMYLKGPKIKRFRFHDWFADHKGHIRFGYGYDRKGNSVMIIRGRGEDDWRVLSDNELFEEGKFSPLQFGTGDNEFYVLSSLATGRMAVYRFDIATGTLGDLVFEHDSVDLTGIEYSFDKGKVVAARYDEDGARIHYLDEEFGNLRKRLAKALKTGFNIWSRSDDDQNMIILSGDERDAGSFFRYNVKAKELNYLGSRLLGLHSSQLSEMDSITYETRDGLTINGILTKPRLHDGKPLPFIVMPHSQPDWQDSVEWDRTAQFFANRGYGVFQPNYRGSSGFGQRFRALGRGEWGRDMQNDLADGAEWLIDEGHAEEGKICIIGRGYAGYAALMGVAKDGDLFSCAVARDAPVDIGKMLRDQDAGKEGSTGYLEVAGDLKKKELDSISPAELIDDIKAPVLIYHWEDSYYNVKHTRGFVKALAKAKKQVDYLEIPESKGKDLYNANDDQRQFLELVENWLLTVNPTPLLIEASKSGKTGAARELTRSSR